MSHEREDGGHRLVSQTLGRMCMGCGLAGKQDSETKEAPMHGKQPCTLPVGSATAATAHYWDVWNILAFWKFLTLKLPDVQVPSRGVPLLTWRLKPYGGCGVWFNPPTPGRASCTHKQECGHQQTGKCELFIGRISSSSWYDNHHRQSAPKDD